MYNSICLPNEGGHIAVIPLISAYRYKFCCIRVAATFDALFVVLQADKKRKEVDAAVQVVNEKVVKLRDIHAKITEVIVFWTCSHLQHCHAEQISPKCSLKIHQNRVLIPDKSS